MTTAQTPGRTGNDTLEAVWPQLRVPPINAELRREADLAVAGTLLFRWKQDEEMKVGRRGIDWSGGPGIHQEARAQLHRFFWLKALAAAWKDNADEAYAAAAREYIDDWIAACPPGDNWNVANGDNTLNLAIRMGSCLWLGWPGAAAAFAGSANWDAEFVNRMLASVEGQLNYLSGHLTPAANWRIAQADALLTTSIREPQLASAPAWQALGVKLLNEAARLQFLPDGAHIELTPSYHSWMAEVFDNYWQLSQAMPQLGLEIDRGLVHRAYLYLFDSIRPNGDYNRLHDCHRSFNNKRYNALYAAFKLRAGIEEDVPFSASRFYPVAGQALLRHGSGKSADYVTFDASPYAGAHSHLSHNSIQIDVAGRPILVDPGILDYETTNPLMAHGRGTRSHNTINFNGWNQAPVTCGATHYCSMSGYDFITSRNEGGFWPNAYNWGFGGGLAGGLWASHQRTMLWAHDRYIVVIDSVRYVPRSASELPFIECNWQFDEGVEVSIDEPMAQAVTHFDDANLLLRVIDVPPATSLKLHQGEDSPLRGWVVGETGVVAAPQLCVSCTAPAPGYAQFVTLLVPFRGQQAPEISAEVTPANNGRRIAIANGPDTDYVFIGEADFTFEDEAMHFCGRAGLLHRRGEASHLWLPLPGTLRADGQNARVLPAQGAT